MDRHPSGHLPETTGEEDEIAEENMNVEGEGEREGSGRSRSSSTHVVIDQDGQHPTTPLSTCLRGLR